MMVPLGETGTKKTISMVVKANLLNILLQIKQINGWSESQQEQKVDKVEEMTLLLMVSKYTHEIGRNFSTSRLNQSWTKLFAIPVVDHRLGNKLYMTKSLVMLESQRIVAVQLKICALYKVQNPYEQTRKCLKQQSPKHGKILFQ